MDRRIQECLEQKEGSYILPFFWQHGEDHDTLLEEIEAMQRCHVREFCVESRIHQQFCEDQWWEDMGFILKEAKKRGMKVWLLDDKQFPTGYANGKMVEHPELRKRGVRETCVDVLGPMVQGAVAAYDRYDPGRENLLGVYAYRRCPEGVFGDPIDLTDHVQDGLLYWDIPEGVWRVFFVIDTDASPDCYREYIDMLSKESCQLMLQAVYEPHYEHFAEYFGNTFAGFFSDEPCFANDMGHYDSKVGTPGLVFPWKAELTGLMAKEMGVSEQKVLAMLPALWYDCGAITAPLRQAYMETITKLYSENFCWMLGDWCREHNVLYIGHVIEDMNAHMRTGYGAGHYFRALDGQDMGGIDIVLNQLVPGLSEVPHTSCIAGGRVDPEFFTYTLAKMAASHGHLQPLKRGRAMCEIFGAFGWAEGLPMMKRMADHMLVNGINYFVPHAFTPKYPDSDCPPYFYYKGKNPQHQLFGRLMQYMQRVSHVLSGGTHQASAAVLYNAEAEWAGGDYMLFQKPCKALTRAQIDFDIVHEDLLYKEDALVKDGQLCIGGETFGALIVPYSELLPYRLVEAMARLAKQGLRVWFIDGLCADSSEHRDIRCFDPLFCTVPLSELPARLREEGLFELAVKDSCPDLRFYHVKREGSDLYMFYNQNASRAVNTSVHLPNAGACVFYDAFDNTVSQGEAPDGWLPLYLEGGNACIVAFGQTAGDVSELPAWMAVPEGERTPLHLRFSISLQNAGEKEFVPYREDAAPFNLTSPQGNPRFCGTARYETVFTLDKAEGRVFLDLGTVGETAQVSVNGIPCGVRIQAPYRFDITEAVGQGENDLVIDVVNSPAYRERDGFSRYLAFPPSGLIGPVSIVNAAK